MKKPMKVTVDDVLGWHPCLKYKRDRIEGLFGRRKKVSASDILDMPIPAEDALWAISFITNHTDASRHVLAAALEYAVAHCKHKPKTMQKLIVPAIDALRSNDFAAMHIAVGKMRYARYYQTIMDRSSDNLTYSAIVSLEYYDEGPGSVWDALVPLVEERSNVYIKGLLETIKQACNKHCKIEV